MDYQNNGINYLVLDNNFKTNKFYSEEINHLKNWLFTKNISKNEINIKNLNKINTKIEFIINNEVLNWEYENINLDNNINNNKNNDLELNIPENYFRFKKLLDIKINDI